MFSLILVIHFYGLVFIKCAQIITLEKDFNNALQDPELGKNVIVGEAVAKLRSFPQSLHPRIPAIYQILRRGMRQYAQQHADSLYMPHKYTAGKTESEKAPVAAGRSGARAGRRGVSYNSYNTHPEFEYEGDN